MVVRRERSGLVERCSGEGVGQGLGCADCLTSGLGVVPFVEQGPVEPFCFAIGPGAAWFDESAFELSGRAHPAPIYTAPVDDHGVVGHQALHADPVGGEPGQRSAQESRSHQVFLTGQHFAIGQPGVAINDGVDVFVTDSGLSVPYLATEPAASRSCRRHPPPTGMPPGVLMWIWISDRATRCS